MNKECYICIINNNLMKLSVISIDLSRFSTKEDIQKVLNDNNISSLSAEGIAPYSSKVYKIYIDIFSKKAIAVQYKGISGISMTKEGESLFLNMIALKPLDTIEDTKSVNDILDKINESGLGSLTTKEKFTLRKSN